MKSRRWLIGTSALLALTLAAAQPLPELGEAAQADLSPQAERRLGESFMRDLRLRDPAYVEDPEIARYLNALGARLAAASPDPNREFSFFAMNDPTLNAFAMPGGFVGVHTGLILAAQSESELAGVIAHEISHVTQRHIARMVSTQGQSALTAWAAVIVAILAARSNSQLSQAALATGQAAAIQTQLNYSREFEREADRIGLQTLEGAGFDVHGMASFFGRLQQAGRLYENNAPAYLRTHPLTTERIADMENRAELKTYRQVPDSLDFQLVRAKIRAGQGTPREAAAEFEAQLREKKYSSEAAARYGHARALLRAGQPQAAQLELDSLRGAAAASVMVDTLNADLRLQVGDARGAAALLRAAVSRHPGERVLVYRLAEAELAAKAARGALEVVAPALRLTPSDVRLWALQAKAYAALGKRLQSHRSQAEVYALQGQTGAAIEQLQFAQRAGDGDFYDLSAVDARLRELRAELRAREATASKAR
ncbi:MAG TPA: peptidase M48 [Rhodocyclaceae bacterium]|nr:MAG: peptidase M48 [Betaproteobacteria bacterium CG2_30_68_42]PIV73180.1 MAG: peptidase M48 [Rhodocyclales bacterium CG17_big_fil_post_rev_8_21_14_2_50_68_7]HCX33870.1 peptidase M48 [Rhodocyclaceae bacterium]